MAATAHLDFILAAYAAAVIVVGGLTAWVLLDYRAQQRRLAELEMQGVIRRSSAATRPGQAMEQAEEQA